MDTRRMPDMSLFQAVISITKQVYNDYRCAIDMMNVLNEVIVVAPKITTLWHASLLGALVSRL